MQTLEKQVKYGSFLEQLKTAEQRVLLLDYDGTLAPFRAARDHAFPYPGIPYLVSRIMSVGTRVVMVSGRRAEEVAALSGIRPQPEIWGSHGLERITVDGTYSVADLEPHKLTGLSQASLWLNEEGMTRVRDRFVVSAPLTGRVLRIELEPGDPVKTGQVVARVRAEASPLLDARTRLEPHGAGLARA